MEEMKPNLLIEHVESDLLFEAVGGRYLVRGEFGKYDSATENKRVYSRPLMEREIGRISPDFPKRQVYGELDHPDDGRTRLQRVSHIITNLRLKDGKVVGEAELIPTSKGKDLIELFKAKCRVGVSSRGYGTTKPNDKGEDVVQEDYKLVTFDFVADPADTDAYPALSVESTEPRKPLLFEGMDLNSDPALEETKEDPVTVNVEELRAQLRREVEVEFEEKMKKHLSEEVTKVQQTLSSQLDEAKAAADAKVVQIQTESQAKIAAVEETNSQLESLARQIGLKYVMESQLSNNPHADEVKAIVGDLDAFETLSALKATLSEAIAQVEKRHEDETKASDTRRQQLERMHSEYTVLKEENAQLRSAVDQALAVAKTLGVKYYAEQRIGRHPKAAAIRIILEKCDPKTKEEVDEIIEQFRPAKKSREEIERTASQIREHLQGGISSIPFLEEQPEQRKPPVLEEDSRSMAQERISRELGISFAELRQRMPF